jgi:hypothetical protein
LRFQEGYAALFIPANPQLSAIPPCGVQETRTAIDFINCAGECLRDNNCFSDNACRDGNECTDDYCQGIQCSYEVLQDFSECGGGTGECVLGECIGPSPTPTPEISSTATEATGTPTATSSRTSTPTPEPLRMTIDSIQASPGERASFEVNLEFGVGTSSIAFLAQHISPTMTLNPFQNIFFFGTTSPRCQLHPHFDGWEGNPFESPVEIDRTGFYCGEGDCEGLNVVLGDPTGTLSISSSLTLYTCDVRIPSSANPGQYWLGCDEPFATTVFPSDFSESHIESIRVPIDCEGGQLLIPGPSHTPTPTRTPTPGPVVLRIAAKSARRGGLVTIEMGLEYDDHATRSPVKALDHVVELPSGFRFAGNPDSVCMSTATIAYETEEYVLEGDEARRVHVVLAVQEPGGIPPTGPLYSCLLEVSPDIAPGDHVLQCTEAIAFDRHYRSWNARCEPGHLEVTDLPPMPTRTPTPSSTPTPTRTHDAVRGARIVVGDAEGFGGNRVQFDVWLEMTPDTPNVRQVHTLLEFDSGVLVIGDDGQPDCEINPFFFEENWLISNRLIPEDCLSEVDCSAVWTLMAGSLLAEPIAESIWLFSCEIAIVASAEPGTYPLSCSDHSVLDDARIAVSSVCVDGDVRVLPNGAPTSTPTPTPREASPRPASTATSATTPAVGSPTPTLTTTPVVSETETFTVSPTPTVTGCAADCSGDGVVSIGELIRAVNVALGHFGLEVCPALDVNRDDRVKIDEIIAGVIAALEGCGRTA